jgi:riboflavin synthase
MSRKRGTAIESLPAFRWSGKPECPDPFERSRMESAIGRVVFTGLVETSGKLAARSQSGPGFRLSVKTALGPLELGESISVNGACLTVARIGADGFDADISEETAALTTLGKLVPGALLNLERSLSLGSRLGGHLVTGHVDGIARVGKLEKSGEASKVTLEAPKALLRYVAVKGSVALDGVSLTVNGVGPQGFDVMLIPHTLAVTNLGGLRPGRELNLEVDLLARYVARYLDTAEPGAGTAGAEDGLTRALKQARIL